MKLSHWLALSLSLSSLTTSRATAQDPEGRWEASTKNSTLATLVLRASAKGWLAEGWGRCVPQVCPWGAGVVTPYYSDIRRSLTPRPTALRIRFATSTGEVELVLQVLSSHKLEGFYLRAFSDSSGRANVADRVALTREPVAQPSVAIPLPPEVFRDSAAHARYCEPPRPREDWHSVCTPRDQRLIRRRP